MESFGETPTTLLLKKECHRGATRSQGPSLFRVHSQCTPGLEPARDPGLPRAGEPGRRAIRHEAALHRAAAATGAAGRAGRIRLLPNYHFYLNKKGYQPEFLAH